jgi:sRNA-binding protein
VRLALCKVECHFPTSFVVQNEANPLKLGQNFNLEATDEITPVVAITLQPAIR